MNPCFHCGEPAADAPWIARVRGEDKIVCCPGCKSAAEWIEALGLGEYYRLREAAAPRADRDQVDYSAWDRPALAKLHVREHAPDRAEIVLLVDHLRCAACAWLIETALSSVAGVVAVAVNAPAKRVRLEFDPRRILLSTLLGALARLGYAPQPLTATALDALREREHRDALKRLIVAGVGAMQAMMYAVALYAGAFAGVDPSTRAFFRWLDLGVATPVVFYAGYPFFAGALREWRARRLSMDTPVALALALVFGASVIALVRGGEIYFDSISMFVLFLLAGRYLELSARQRAGDLVDALARAQPATAERLRAEGCDTVAVHELMAGDIVRVGAGSIVPADGTLRAGTTRVDESLLTGEAMPRRRNAGESLVAGSLVIDGPIELTVAHVGSDTVLASCVRLVTRAASAKPRLARAADARAARFVPRVLVATVATALLWCWIDPSRAFAAAVSVLVVSCPCAFALAVPAAMTRAIGVLARAGVLVVDADALEALARADRFVFDKTGTLTRPAIERTEIVAVRGTSDRALALAAALEQGSTHPLAHAIGVAANGLALPTVSSRREQAGVGVDGIVDGCRVTLGRAEDGASADALVLADDQGPLAYFPIRETLRPHAVDALDALRAAGARAEIASGDTPSRVNATARRLGVTEWHAELSAADKLVRLTTLQREGHVVAMIGDGVNDSPILAGADVAIAFASGAALAHAASGILIVGDSLDAIALAQSCARRTVATMRQNAMWSYGYNALAIPLAALGYVPPWLAAVGMSLSSIVVIANSLRIRGAPSAALAAHSAPIEEAIA